VEDFRVFQGEIVSSILDRINSPEDLRALSYIELDKLATELREEMIKTISSNGGHLASSLGAVEIAIALHRVLHSPKDKIIWDVGHQCYAHKLLTGRKDRFSSIRQYGGLSGFPSRSESPHDAFTSGHAGNSISASMGIALARDLNKEKFEVAAVIGDGSLGTGMAFEALNHAGHKGTKMIVVLNDNGMAISPTLGALSKILNQVRSDARYESAKIKFGRAIVRIPFGRSALKYTKIAKRRFERVLMPNAFWEQMGFVYLGPLDGHNIKELEAALVRARDFESRPVIVHVMTVKGKGYQAAEDDAVKFHGLSPTLCVKENGHSSYSQVFGKTVQRLLKDNSKVVVISAAMLDGTGLAEAACKYPDRVFDVGICEQHAVTMAAGLATQGFFPIVAIYSTFLQRAYDQIVHDVCLPNLPVVFAIDRAGIVGEDGATHQGSYDIAYLSSIPNMIIAAPKDEDELQHLIFSALNAGQPIAVRYPRGYGEGKEIQAEFQSIPVGKGELLKSGSDLAIIAFGSTVYPALGAARVLAEEGLDCSVVNARFAKPLDSELILEACTKTGNVLTVEEGVLRGGFGSSVLDILNKSGLNPMKVESIGLPDRFVEHGSPEIFRSKFDLDSEGIVRRIKMAFPELFLNPLVRLKHRN
jgi:1-deoxy-D-xylulose-5-phosphate synthase